MGRKRTLLSDLNQRPLLRSTDSRLDGGKWRTADARVYAILSISVPLRMPQSAEYACTKLTSFCHLEMANLQGLPCHLMAFVAVWRR
jgi:hypothetical protein